MSDGGGSDGPEHSGDESDRELQAAFESGLLKAGLNVPVQRKRPPINNTAALDSALSRLRSAAAGALPWLERLDVTHACASGGGGGTDAAHSDFDRELAFYEQARAGALDGLGRLRALAVPTDRPADYFAEMAKSDEHMHKVRGRLQTAQAARARRDRARQIRDERKHAAAVQKGVERGKVRQRKELALAVKKHKKGFKEQLNQLLGDTAEAKARHVESKMAAAVANKKRAHKNERFGMGGRKRGLKLNTKESVDEVGSFSARSGVKANKRGRPMKGKLRPGGPKKFSAKQKLKRRK